MAYHYVVNAGANAGEADAPDGYKYYRASWHTVNPITAEVWATHDKKCPPDSGAFRINWGTEDNQAGGWTMLAALSQPAYRSCSYGIISLWSRRFVS